VLTRNPPKPPARISPGQPPARQEPKPLHQAGSWEDKVYTRALELNPYLADLVEKLHLVNPKTGRPYTSKAGLKKPSRALGAKSDTSKKRK